jgi:hypothetical protein
LSNRRFELALALATCIAATPARDANAQDTGPDAAARDAVADPGAQATEGAREAFLRGTEFARNAHWSEALAEFERSASLRPHAVTTYNEGACQRALGRYTLARKTLQQALDENDRTGGAQLPEATIADIRGYLAQIDALLATADVVLDPPNAAIAVDGRPLEPAGDGAPLTAGTRPPALAEVPPGSRFRVLLDPGAHVITVSRRGYADAVVNRTFPAGVTVPLALRLDRLPANLHIEADRPRAVVTVDGYDVGLAPVDVARPAGSYRIVVRKAGFTTYEADVVVQAGEAMTLNAKLRAESIPITQRWWFWTAATALLAGAATGTYFIARDATTPSRPPLDGGGLGWTVQAH